MRWARTCISVFLLRECHGEHFLSCVRTFSTRWGTTDDGRRRTHIKRHTSNNTHQTTHPKKHQTKQHTPQSSKHAKSLNRTLHSHTPRTTQEGTFFGGSQEATFCRV
ncbi:hypothetical protein BKA56DRAFT_204570 [Ilyonectria sp. MPI-CAGE-AT-0026]|nr:hypothetical protein BKA56DRAFT_204570 [Ilyonectria sp. MPI-CAGE-AT-0026]